MRVGVALVHAEEIGSEQRRLLAAGAGAHFEDRALLVGGVLGQKLHLELPLELFDLRYRAARLLLGERRHRRLGGWDRRSGAEDRRRSRKAEREAW